MIGRLAHIDAIRGFAALAVVYFHLAEFFRKNVQSAYELENQIFLLLSQHIDLGKIGIILFFAVSGFVIPHSLSNKGDRPLAKFTISRFFRLYPAYWLSIPLGVLFLYHLPGKPISLKVVLLNITMLQQFLGVENIIGLYWTLQIELIFYVMCATLFWLKVLNRPMHGCIMVLVMLVASLGVAAARFILDRKLPVALPLSLAVMFWGFGWRCLIIERMEGARRAVLMSTAAIAVLIVPICILGYSRDTGLGESWGKYVVTYVASLALFALLTTKIKVTNAAAVYIGSISYSVYLFGPIGQEIALLLCQSFGADVPLHVAVAASVLITLAMASLVYVAVEKPAISIGRIVVRKL